MGRGDERHFFVWGLKNAIFVYRVLERPFFKWGSRKCIFVMYGVSKIPFILDMGSGKCHFMYVGVWKMQFCYVGVSKMHF